MNLEQFIDTQFQKDLNRTITNSIRNPKPRFNSTMATYATLDTQKLAPSTSRLTFQKKY